VGLLTTIGLSSKNAILIVEFARDLEAQGKSAIDAAVEAAQMRLRPILMTSLALSLAAAAGHRQRAGSGSQNAVGAEYRRHVERDVSRSVPDPMFFFVITEKLFKTRSAPDTSARRLTNRWEQRPNETPRPSDRPAWRSCRA